MLSSRDLRFPRLESVDVEWDLMMEEEGATAEAKTGPRLQSSPPPPPPPSASVYLFAPADDEDEDDDSERLGREEGTNGETASVGRE